MGVMSHAHENDRVIAPVPRVTIHGFCETQSVADALAVAALDRRLQRAQVTTADPQRDRA